MLTEILDIIDTGSKLLLLEAQQRVQNLVLQLRNDYAQELNLPYGQIDDARLFSIESELRNVISVYSAAVQGQAVAAQPK